MFLDLVAASYPVTSGNPMPLARPGNALPLALPDLAIICTLLHELPLESGSIPGTYGLIGNPKGTRNTKVKWSEILRSLSRKCGNTTEIPKQVEQDLSAAESFSNVEGVRLQMELENKLSQKAAAMIHQYCEHKPT